MTSTNELLLAKKFQEYCDTLDSLDVEMEDLFEILKCTDATLLKKIIEKADYDEHIFSAVLKFVLLSQEVESPILVKLFDELNFLDAEHLIELGFMYRNFEVISWCLRNNKPNVDSMITLGEGIDTLCQIDADTIVEILLSLDENAEVDLSNSEDDDSEIKYISKKWWLGINDYSEKYNYLVEKNCPFDEDELENVGYSSDDDSD